MQDLVSHVFLFTVLSNVYDSHSLLTFLFQNEVCDYDPEQDVEDPFSCPPGYRKTTGYCPYKILYLNVKCLMSQHICIVWVKLQQPFICLYSCEHESHLTYILYLLQLALHDHIIHSANCNCLIALTGCVCVQLLEHGAFYRITE